MIKRICIRNYRLFREFDLEFSPGTNILVGSNETGKSTLIEAINIALTGRLHGKPLTQELSPYLVNLDATREYIEGLKAAQSPPPPIVIIELYLDATEETETLRGTNNLSGEDACGVRIQAKLASEYADEYARFVADPKDSAASYHGNGLVHFSDLPMLKAKGVVAGRARFILRLRSGDASTNSQAKREHRAIHRPNSRKSIRFGESPWNVLGDISGVEGSQGGCTQDQCHGDDPRDDEDPAADERDVLV